MIKKIFIFIAFLWFVFLGVLVFRDQIVDFLGQPKEEQKTVQHIPPTVVPPPTIENKPIEEPKPDVIPFRPLPDAPVPIAKKEVVQKTEDIEEKKQEVVVPAPNLGTENSEDIFGLICTKFERIPSRFRLISWEGQKKVELEDLSKFNSKTKSYPRFWLRLRLPYKEFINPSTQESFFRPTNLKDPNKRLIVQSLEIKKEALNYSSRSNSIGYVIMRDFKIGGPPYQITSEMEKPLTTAYTIQFEQSIGPQKFFHDLTGKPNGHPFGGWGFEYKITKQNFAQNKIKVLRKDQKTGRLSSKELEGPSSL